MTRACSLSSNLHTVNHLYALPEQSPITRPLHRYVCKRAILLKYGFKHTEGVDSSTGLRAARTQS